LLFLQHFLFAAVDQVVLAAVDPDMTETANLKKMPNGIVEPLY
jgi:hypothetical protein